MSSEENANSQVSYGSKQMRKNFSSKSVNRTTTNYDKVKKNKKQLITLQSQIRTKSEIFLEKGVKLRTKWFTESKLKSNIYPCCNP